MNDSTPITETTIDERARRAAATLTQTIDRRSIPERHQRNVSPRATGVFAIAAALVIVVAGLVTLRLLRDQPSRPTDNAALATTTVTAPASTDAIVETTATLRWVVTDLPVGWQLQNAFESAIAPTPIDDHEWTLYATPQAPFGPVMMIATSVSDPADDDDATNVTEVTVDGVELIAADGPLGQRWVYNVALSVAVIGRSLDDATLEAVAVGLVRSNDGAVAPAAETIPAEMTLAGSLPSAMSGASFDQRVTPSATTTYGPVDHAPVRNEFLSLNITPTAPLAAAVFGLRSEDVRTVQSGSRTLFIGGLSDAYRSATWTADGLTFVIGAAGITEAELIAAADSTALVSNEVWAAATVTSAASGQLEPPATLAPAGDIVAFCATLPSVDTAYPESYIGSDAHIATFDELIDLAPAELQDSLRLFRTYLVSEVAGNPDPEANVIENFPADVQTAVAEIMTFQTQRCAATPTT